MFKGSKAKLNRADKLIAELSENFIKFSKANSANATTRLEGRTFTLRVASPALPDDLATAMGDAMNNLRSALDLLVSPVGIPGKKTKFPFSNTKLLFQKAIKESNIAHQGVRDYIEHAVMPYKGGDDDIWALHHTDIVNKHYDLISSDSRTALRNANIWTRGLTINDLTFEGGNGQPMISSDSPIYIYGGGVTETTMHFTADSHFGQVPIISKLLELSKKVRSIVVDVEKLVANN